MQSLKEGIFIEDSYPGPTIGAVLLPRGMIFIDTPLRPEDGQRWKSTLLNRSRGTIHRLLVCLDDHPDRTIGANGMNCPILTHKGATETLMDYSSIFRGQLPESGSLWEKYPETTGLQWVVPDISFSERIKLHWGAETLLVEHHPGPRPGASWVDIPDQEVIFIGDAAVAVGTPFLGKSDLESWIDTLNLLIRVKYKNYTIISSRGGKISQDEIKEQRKTLRKILRRIEKLAGKSAPPEDVADLAENYLEDFNFTKKDREFYLQRLQHGLYQYYMKNHYSSPEVQEE
jgi:glyoxylase-like metal-dependent hydrolase (beta-lactamase superfamily II)